MATSLVSIPRKLSELRFLSAFSIMVSIYVVLVIVFESILLHGTSESLEDGFKAGSEKKELSVSALFSSLPLIIFSYMYQVNVPGIY